MYPHKMLSVLNKNLFFPLFKDVDELRHEKEKSKDKDCCIYDCMINKKVPIDKIWPDNIFIPSDILFTWIVKKYYEKYGQMMPKEKAWDLYHVAGCASSWRPTQDIVKFDQTLLAHLREMQFSGNLPAEIFERLPAWCVYFDIGDININDESCYGFFARLDFASKYEDIILTLSFACEDGGLIRIDFPLNCSLQESLDMSNSISEYKVKITDDLILALNMVIYVCTYGLNDGINPITSNPIFPQSRKTKKGWRIFPPDKAKIRFIGQAFGNLIRKAESSYLPGSGTSKKPHIRRAHWHSFWVGAKADIDNRKLIVKWLHPMIIGGLDKCEV